MSATDAAKKLVEAINHAEHMTYAEQLKYIGKLEEIRAELRNVLRLMIAAPDRVDAASVSAELMQAYDAMLKDQLDCLTVLK